MTLTMKILFGFLVLMETVGVVLAAVEVAIMIGDAGTSYHWLGYLGAFLGTTGAFLWAKLFQTWKAARGA